MLGILHPLFSSLGYWEAFLLSPLICIMCSLLLYIVQTMSWPLLYGEHIVFIPSFLCSTGLIMGICWLFKNQVDRFFQTSFTFPSLLATLVPEIFDLCFCGKFACPTYCYLSSKLCYIVLFARKTSVLLGIQCFFCINYPYQKIKLYNRVLI